MGRLVGAPFFAWGICRGCAGPFAGKPAPTHRSAVDIHRGAQAVVGAGSPANGPGLLANIPGRSPLPWPPYSRVNPLLHLIGGGHTLVIGRSPS
ncbi:hypothetical protein PRJ_1075 [Pseudomonas sp. XWY-1]|nr:hypothetical protein PRJ_1075 [Pseudomonas sp. XWY-1]